MMVKLMHKRGEQGGKLGPFALSKTIPITWEGMHGSKLQSIVSCFHEKYQRLRKRRNANTCTKKDCYSIQ